MTSPRNAIFAYGFNAFTVKMSVTMIAVKTSATRITISTFDSPPNQHWQPIKVQYYETDKMQVTHHSNYLRFLEEARIDFLDQIGWGYAKMEEEGIISPVLALSCDYRHTTTFPDVLTIQVTIEKLTAVRLVLGYTVRCGEKIACTATTTHCFIRNGNPLVLQKDMPDFYRDLRARCA